MHNMKKVLLSTVLACSSFLGFSQIPNTNIKANYKLNGNLIDDSNSNLNGDYTGAVPGADRFGNPTGAYHFDGNDTLNISHNGGLTFNSSEDFTISFWAKVNEHKSQHFVSHKNGAANGILIAEVRPGIGDSKKVVAAIEGDNNVAIDLISNDTLEIGVWYNIALVHDATSLTASLYIDNELNSSTSTAGLSGDFGVGSIPFSFGKRVNEVSDNYLNGAIDDIWIFDKALDCKELTGLYLESTVQNSFTDTSYVTITDTNYVTVNTTSATCTLSNDSLINHFKLTSYGCSGVNPNDCQTVDSTNWDEANVYGATYGLNDRKDGFSAGFSFDGVDDYLEIPHSAKNDFNGDFTVGMWFKVDSTHESGSLLSKWAAVSGANYPLVIRVDNFGNNKGRVYAAAFDGANSLGTLENVVNDTISLDYSNFHFVTVTKENDIMTTYLDNNKLGEVNISSLGNTNNTENIQIGRRKNHSQRFFKGEIDDIKFYNRALSDCEVVSLYNEGDEVNMVYDTLFVGAYTDTNFITVNDTNYINVNNYVDVYDSLIVDLSGNVTAIGTSFNLNTQVKIYPNPASETLTLEVLDAVATETYLYQLFSVTGQNVVTNGFLDNEIKTIDLSGLSSGTYYVKFFDSQFNLVNQSPIVIRK